MLNLLRFLRTYVALVRDPNQLQRVFALGERLARGDLFVRMPWLRGRPEIEAVVSRPARHLAFDRARLGAMPLGTLGRAFVDFLDRHGLDPGELAHSTGDSTLDRFRIHLQGTHDLWHVLTGFDTDVDGELGLQAFYFAQLQAPLTLTLMSAGLLNMALMEEGSGAERMEQMVQGYLMGRRAAPLTGVDWSAHWERPLSEVRDELRLDVGPSVLVAA